MTFSAILLDLDGTVLDTTGLILASLRHATATVFGVVPDDAQLMANFGRTLEDSLRALGPELTDAQLSEFTQIYLDHNVAQHDRLVAVVPGVEAVLAQLQQEAIPLAIVTSKRRESALHGLEVFGLDRYFQAVVAREDTDRHKPDPEPVREGLRRIRVDDAAHALYIGDSPYDMRAGRAAGCQAWGIVHNTFSRQVLEDAGASRIAEGWASIGEWLGG